MKQTEIDLKLVAAKASLPIKPAHTPQNSGQISLIFLKWAQLGNRLALRWLKNAY